MAARVRDFFQAQPSDEPGHVELLTRLEARLRRTDALGLQERAGILQETAAIGRRRRLRRRIHEDLLPHLVRVGRAVAAERPDLAGLFVLPNKKLALRVWLDMTKAMMVVAAPARDYLVGRGLSKTLLDDLAPALAEFDQCTEDAHAGRRAHVGASADLGLETAEIMKLVEQLDGLNRYRYRQDGELRAAWRSARNVAGPFGPNTPKEPAEQQDTPPSGGATTAA